MGQAKRRGTYEERKAQAIQREKERIAELDRLHDEREREAQAKWAAMSPQEQEEHIKERGKNRLALSSLALIAAALGVPYR